MKHLVILIIFLFGVSLDCNARCISGDCLDGQGSETGPGGETYVGQYKDGKLNGQGTYTYANGDKFVGQFEDNKKNGHGTITFVNTDQYSGQWENNKMNGQGKNGKMVK